MFDKLPFKQMMRIVKVHFFANIVLFMFGMVFASAVYGTKFGMILFTTIAMLIYSSVLYSDAYNIAGRDKKSYTKEDPYFCKGFLLPIGLIVITAVLYIMHYLVWKYMTVDAHLTDVSWLLNMIFIIWTYASNGIIGLQKGIMQWYGYIIVFIVPVIISGLGYIAGLKNFDPGAKLSRFVYENKNENKK